MALQHVNYPTQVIGKSCKPIPVMILGVLYGKKRYPLQKYLFILMIVMGVALFVWKDGKTKSNEDGGWFGYFLLFFSLAMDGMTGGIQDRMRLESKPSFSQMMYNINFWSSVILAGALFVTSEIWTFTTFVQNYPFVMTDIFWFSILSAFGQLFIFLTVVDFGPLPLSLVTTTRKFFTVLASIIYFGNPATSRQYAGTVLVFLGLALDTWKGKDKKPTANDRSLNGKDKTPLIGDSSKD
jgi:drug/metabolite transporter (DMT)-like permease